ARLRCETSVLPRTHPQVWQKHCCNIRGCHSRPAVRTDGTLWSSVAFCLDTSDEFFVGQSLDVTILQLPIPRRYFFIGNIGSRWRKGFQKLANQVGPLTFRQRDSLLLDLVQRHDSIIADTVAASNG